MLKIATVLHTPWHVLLLLTYLLELVDLTVATKPAPVIRSADCWMAMAKRARRALRHCLNGVIRRLVCGLRIQLQMKRCRLP